ncbi:MAG TPA: hypothetical protein VN643_27065 [Pyrinomonadaceae bacterium]|nr:hypothetical protein [Pyrinomonadaceae bacterium]
MKRTFLFLSLILCLVIIPSARHTSAVTREKNFTAWFFVEVETTVHRKSDTERDEPAERRWYISNAAIQPEDVPTYSLVKKTIIPYFTKTVTDPAEAKGFIIDYYDNDVRLNGESSFANYATREETEEARKKAIDYRKDQSGNIYSFELALGAAKGEETSKPKLIYRDKEQPNYEPK